jgi:hypothetical protein
MAEIPTGPQSQHWIEFTALGKLGRRRWEYTERFYFHRPVLPYTDAPGPYVDAMLMFSYLAGVESAKEGPKRRVEPVSIEPTAWSETISAALRAKAH